MNHKRKFNKSVIIPLFLILFFQSCVGYQLGSSLPSDIQTIFIPTFKNQSDEPLVENKVTNETISEFQFDGSLEVVSRNSADLILEGTVTSLSLDPIAYQRQDTSKPNEYRLKLKADIELIRASTKEILARTSASGESTFNFVGNITSAKKAAIPKAARDLAENIVDEVIEIW
jgi:hypothetical protein